MADLLFHRPGEVSRFAQFHTETKRSLDLITDSDLGPGVGG